jgi:hypothetical protein
MRDKIIKATSFAFSLFSPAGPTHDGQPLAHEHEEISSRVR